jgi:hypothetical protein
MAGFAVVVDDGFDCCGVVEDGRSSSQTDGCLLLSAALFGGIVFERCPQRTREPGVSLCCVRVAARRELGVLYAVPSISGWASRHCLAG